MAEQPAARTVGRQLHAPEVIAFDVRQAVVPRDAFVDERVVGVQELEHAAILAQHAREEELRLAPQALAQRVVEVRKNTLHRDHGVEVAQVQPLAREVGDERIGARIGDHAPHLALELRGLAQRAALGGAQQLVVGDAAP